VATNAEEVLIMAKVKWSEIIRDNWDAIKEKAVEAYKRAAYCDLSGWHYDIEIDQNGDVSACGPLSQGSQSGESWNGDSYVVIRIKTWQPENDDYMGCMANSDNNYGTSYIEEFEASDYDYDWEFMGEKYPDKVKEWLDDIVDAEVEAYERETIDSLIEQAIKDAKMDEAEQEAREEWERSLRAE